MWVLRSESISLGENRLIGLRPSVNAPCLESEDLGGGPIRGAVATLVDSNGLIDLCLPMRGLRSGQAWLYEAETPLAGVSELHDALYEALIFGEGLGFLFDDDLVEGVSGLADAEAFWRRLMSPGPAQVLPAEAYPRTGCGSIGLTKFRGRGLDSLSSRPVQNDLKTLQNRLPKRRISRPNLGQLFTRAPQGGPFMQAEHPE